MRISFIIIILITLVQSSFAQANNVSLLSHWSNPSLPTLYDGESVYNEVWGFMKDGVEYAVIGSRMGTHILRIDVNNQLVEVDFVIGKHTGSDAIHRDYHDYQNYLYAVCDEGPSSLQIMDLSYLPDSVSLVYDNDSLITRSHNIFIDTAYAKLYSCSNKNQSGNNALKVLDISNPTAPTFMYNYDLVSHVHDAYVLNDTAFLNCGNQGLKVITSSSQSNVIQIGELSTYPHKGYNHAGWLNKEGDLYVMCDENHGLDVKVLDVSDLNDINVESLFNSQMGDDANSIPHNVIIRNNIAYVSYYHDGLQVFDLGNPALPQKIGHYDTYNGNPAVPYAGCWGVYPFRDGDKILVSDRATGLFLLGFQPPPLTVEHPFEVFPNPSNGLLYFFKEHYLIADYTLYIYNALGQKMLEVNSNTDYTYLDLTNFRTGLYFINYISNVDDSFFTEKFFIE